MSFASLGLAPALLDAVAAIGHDTPTAIQSAAIPAALQGRDVLGAAQTGSGKTAAFALPMLHALLARQGTRRGLHGLVLVPTRELAAQVGDAIRALVQHLPSTIKVSIAFGGVSINPQMMALRGGTDIIVATPGRLLDLARHNAVKLDGVATLVLDEADKLLDMGFADEIAEILALLPARRQNLFFSATFPAAVQALATSLLHDPVRAQLTDDAADEPDIAQRAIEVDGARRLQLLRHLIKEHGWQQVLVFVATKYASEHVADKLRRNGLAAETFHGDFSQGARTGVLADFKAGRMTVLVATDVAARGIDIAQLPVVVNFDLPRAAADYTHRIGRTGRAGASGIAVSFITPDAEAHFRLIEKRQGRRVPRERIAGFEPSEAAIAAAAAAPVADPNGGVKGKRKSKKDKLREAAAKPSA
ncbi:DEAD/DEAH box helicase [Pseudoduganella umbonata]|uniref:DEAD/DEAH box helicase n=1 Tax=Pseudoduganella umbonata TaxID=864828 RepID=A0A4P8HPJ1_9BURK|nr:DEAD/DEAH box helicase [Pseudoduganella umbonata]MBB3222453.1 superfamily II DNA/RNA helicase [Pseudoduganella umbonata]QCP11006.1 DEAD/DEAH box helicase [Pseudoduganella umbonata]